MPGYALGQPDAVFGAVEAAAVAVHLAALDGKDHRRAVAEADQLGGLQIFREMYLEPGFGIQAVFQYAVHIFFPGSMV